MCTVVVRWSAVDPTQILALRDELTSRDFDDPDAWWPEQPDVIGGRDRLAGGTWCASRVTTGVTALVLNRPQKRIADPGAPSRGVLPLLGVQHESDWVAHVKLDGMASFALVIAAPNRLTSWLYDGTTLTSEEHAAGTHMFTAGGAEDGKAGQHLAEFAQASYPEGWRSLVDAGAPTDDPAALVVRHVRDGTVFATVFAQLIEAQPGRLELQFSRAPWAGETLAEPHPRLTDVYGHNDSLPCRTNTVRSSSTSSPVSAR